MQGGPDTSLAQENTLLSLIANYSVSIILNETEKRNMTRFHFELDSSSHDTT